MATTLPHGTTVERRVTLPTKLFYGLGSVAYGIKDSGFSTLLLLFYNQVIGLDASLVGLAIMIALVADAFVDPVIGHFSDHLKSRWGRRHPFMYAAALPIGMLYILLWNPPIGATSSATVAYLVVVAIAVRSVISAYEVPSMALAPELTSDYHERTSVLGFRYLFGWLGGMGMLLLVFSVLLVPTAHYPQGTLNPQGYRNYSYVAAAIMTLTILASTLGTHHQIRFLPKPVGTRPPIARTFHEIIGTLSNRAFLVLFFAGVCLYTDQGLNFALANYFNTYLWQFPSTFFVIYTLSVMAGVCLAMIWARLASARFGKKRSAIAFLCVRPLIASAPLLGRALGLMPANGSTVLYPLLMAVVVVQVSIGVAATILAASMMADVVEDAQARTGERREGVFFAGSFFMQKCVSGFGLFLSGTILTAVHFPAKAIPGKVPVAVLDHLIVSYCSLIVLFSGLGALVLAHYPLGGQVEHKRRLSELAEAGLLLPGAEGEPTSAAAAWQ